MANDTQRPVEQILQQHFLEGLLRRLPWPDAPVFVLRGSLITRLWAAPFPRAAADLDLLGTYPCSVEVTRAHVVAALGTQRDDAVCFDADRCRAQAIWQDTDFPGVRLALSGTSCGYPARTTIDVGFGDPLVPPPLALRYPWSAGGGGQIWAVHPATLIGWKLHGLAEWGRTRWRPKDLLDLWLLLCSPHVEGLLTPQLLAQALQVAFSSRGYDPADAERTLADPDWHGPAAHSSWRRFCRSQPDVPVPGDIVALHREIVERLAPALALIAAHGAPLTPSHRSPDVD